MPPAPPIEIREHTDDAGHRFTFAPVDHPDADAIGIHFSAFFGAWGDAKVYRDTFQGYFHRRKMLGSDESRDWLFLCDPYGVADNGCYYLGHEGDLFVQRATRDMVEAELARRGHAPERVVMLGSSMGATGALNLGLELGVAGIVAIGPHIDLDTSARMQNRMREVAWVCPDGDALAEHNHHLTRQIGRKLDAWPAGRPLPRLFIQACADDHGVYEEQVVPYADRWRALGGRVDLDIRPVGGHTSEHATRNVLLDATACLLSGADIDVERYRTDPDFVGQPIREPLRHRARGRASKIRKAILGR